MTIDMGHKNSELDSLHSLDRLYRIIAARKNQSTDQSYTAQLLAAGIEKPVRKLSEETTEVIIEALGGNKQALCRESADLLYHLLVVWAACDLQPEAVWQELESRRHQSGLAEKASRPKP